MPLVLRPLALAALATCAHAACCAQAISAQAQATVADVAVPTQEIVIKGQGLQSARPTVSTTTVDPQQIRDQAITQPEELLRLVPGVVVRSLSLGGVVNTITIRGFSSGAHGGDLGMVLDGIPLNEAMSHADGYADLNVVVPLEIDRFQVFRGPVSALYGNFNRGGLIAIETRRGSGYSAVDASLGSFGTRDLQAVHGTRLGQGTLNLAAQLYRSDGYRPGFEHERGTLAGRYTLDVSARTKLSLSLRGHSGDWDSAGNVTQAQFSGADPYGRDPRVVGDGGRKRYASGRIDLDHQINDHLKLLTFVYGNTQDYTRFFTRPVNATPVWSQREETYDRSVTGAGFSLNGRTASAWALDYVVGMELYRESTYFQNYEGTQNRRRVNVAAYDRTYELDSVSAFGEVQARLTPSLRGSLGLRHDRFTGNCSRNGAETGADPCAALNDASRTTPKVGLRWSLSPELDLRASVAEGFALPPGAVKYAPGGGDVAPTVFRQFEVGTSVSLGRRLQADLAAYRIDSDNEVRTVSPGVFENFGTTRRDGVEASLRWRPFAGDLANLEVNGVYSRMKAVVTQNATAALVGNRVTGVPEDAATLGLAWRPDVGLGGTVEARHVGRYAVLADNSVFYPSYTTLDLGLQYSGLAPSAGPNGRWRAYVKIENATDRLYATSTGITSGQQTYNVAAPRGVRAGVQIDL
jgi:outer membrane receptor protein involved in Fe transport